MVRTPLTNKIGAPLRPTFLTSCEVKTDALNVGAWRYSWMNFLRFELEERPTIIQSVRYAHLAYTSQVDSVFLHNLIGSSIWEYPALFTSEQNKMVSSYVYVTEELFFNKRSSRARQHQKSNEIWQLSAQRYVFPLFFL